MTDIEDLVEAVFDIEDIVEELADPEDLFEDFAANPLMVVFAFVAAVAGIFALFLFLITAVVLVFAFGSIWLFVALAVVSVLVMTVAIGAFLYVRTDIPSDVYRKITEARERADDTPKGDGSMTEQEAVDELKDQYARGNLNDYELDQALDDALTSENPEDVVERYETER